MDKKTEEHRVRGKEVFKVTEDELEGNVTK